MSHRNDRLCDEGLRCKKCKDNWDKLSEVSRHHTEDEALRAKVAELQEQVDLQIPKMAFEELQGQLTNEQNKVKVLSGALKEIKQVRVIPAVIYGIAYKALATVKEMK